MKKTLLLLALAGLFLAGCASDPLTVAKKYNVNTVALEPRVDAPTMRYGPKMQGNGDLTSMISSQISNALIDSLHTKGMARMTTEMQQQNINVPEMVRANFVSAARNAGFTFTETNADAVFVLRVAQYGFDDSLRRHGKFPFAFVNAELRNREGKVYWRGGGMGSGLAFPDMGATWDDYEKNPQKLHDDWEKVAGAAAKNILPQPKK